MHELLRELVEPFNRMTPAAASTLLLEFYGLEPLALELLDTERDDTFRVSSTAGEHVLKVAHPRDARGLIALQVEALAHAAGGGQPVPAVTPARDGERMPEVGGRIVRLLDWMPGQLLLGERPTLDQVEALGAALASLAANLADFEHPAARRTFAWDLQSFDALRALAHPTLADAVFDEVAALDPAALPHQVIHNDFHPGNLLVDAADPRYVVGVLDFGDMVHAPRVQDVAVALSYLLPAHDDPRPTIAAFLAGYERVTALLPAERAALLPLIAARLVQRIVLPPLLYGDDLDPARLAHNIATLENLRMER